MIFSNNAETDRPMSFATFARRSCRSMDVLTPKKCFRCFILDVLARQTSYYPTTLTTSSDRILFLNREREPNMNLHDLRARMHRLEELIRGLCLEESLWRYCSAPIMALDRLAYMDAMHEAIHG